MRHLLCVRNAAMLLLMSAALAACSEPAASPKAGALADASADAATADMTTAETADAVALPAVVSRVDILWVLDHSPSSHKDQPNLSRGIGAFVQKLQSAGLEVRTAVTTQQQLADRDNTSPFLVEKVGKFLHTAATKFPPNGIERQVMPCASNDQCQNGTDATLKQAGGCAQSALCANTVQAFTNSGKNVACGGDATCQWRCKSPDQKLYATNQNCSLNSYCWRHCSTDQECRDAFESTVAADKQNMVCFHPGGVPSEQSGCMMPPPTTGCPPPEQLPAILGSGGGDLALLRCLIVPGVSMTQESKLEGPLRAAWQALDPNGPNCPKNASGKPSADCQNQQLLREDALLLIVTVGDDDDCSVDMKYSLDNGTPDQLAALNVTLPVETWDRCQLLGDRLGNNQWLNEATCDWAKSKPGGDAVCPCDCRAMAAGSAEQAACEAKVKLAKVVDVRFSAAADWPPLFKSLKKNPKQVMFAAITGLSTAGLPGAVKADDDAIAFYGAALKNVGPGQAPSICTRPHGANAGFGSRLAQTAQAFGNEGLLQSICTDGDLVGPLDAIASWVGARAGKPLAP